MSIESIKREIKYIKAFDFILALFVTLISSVGVLMVQAVAMLQPMYSALPAQQRLHVITGVVIMLIFSLIDYRFIARFYIPIYVLCISLLVAVLIIGPDDITGTARWIFITLPGGFSMSIQPSEFAKLFLVISLASFLDRQGDVRDINRPLKLLAYVAMAAFPVLLVILQLSLSAAMVLLVLGLSILFIGGLYFRTMIVSALLALPLVTLVYLDMMRQYPLFLDQFLSERQMQRIRTFLDPASVDPDAILQTGRSVFAIGLGGLYGNGFMNNRVFVIHGHNDFIFAVMAEQFGFVGSMAILGMISIVIIKCFLAAYRSVDNLGRLMAGGVASLLLFQSFVNVGVVTDLLPNTGMPFPFMSYGGTHMWTHMAAIGLVLNIGFVRKREDIANKIEN